MDDDQSQWQPAQPAPISWTADQMVRLEHEWRQLQRNFAYHPSVRVTPLQGNPPGEYQIEFTARTLYIREDGQLDFIATPSVHIWLPPGYPHEPPLVRPMQALFHPNITMEGIAILPAWEPTRTIADLVQQIGALLSFHTYDPYNVWNPAAMDWATANPAYLPTDPSATFVPNAGGEPLGRICKNGARTLEQLRGQLNELCGSLLSTDDPPSIDEVKQFAERIRLATGLLLDDDVPDSLRTPAKDLDEWAESLPSTVMTFEGLRQRHIASIAALQAAGKLAEVRRALLKELSTYEQMVVDLPGADPKYTIQHLPDLAAMQAMQTNLRVTANEAEKRLTAAQQRLGALTPPPARMTFSHSELHEKVIEAEMLRATKAIQEAAEKTRSAIETIAPTIVRARDELAVFDRIIGWTDFLVLPGKARELVNRVLGWGSAGVQAYFVENEGGAFGPFEFEQRLDLGAAALAVRNTGRSSIEIYDVQTGRKLAGSDAGAVTVPLPGGEDGGTFPTTFRMTSRCDDLWVQVEYLNRQIGEVVLRQVKPLNAPHAESWAAAYNNVLSAKDSVRIFVEDTKRDVQERMGVISDLKLLSRFKERLATQYLLERQAEMVPRFKAELADATRQLKESSQRIGEIFSRSQRDVESGMPMIPPKFAKDYEINKLKQETAQHNIDRVERLLALSAAQIKPRLTTPALYGLDDVPAPQVLPPLPEEQSGRADLVGEYSMAEQVAGLEGLLGMQLRPDVPIAAPPAARPAQVEQTEAGQGWTGGTAESEVAAHSEHAEETEHAAEAGHEEQMADGSDMAVHDEHGHEHEHEHAEHHDDVVDFGFDPKK